MLLVGCAGVIFLHRDTIMSGLDIVQADIGDSRLITFLLDHWKRVFDGVNGWSSPTMFFPLHGTLGYSDMLLGLGVPYAIFRWIGLGLFQSANATLILLSFLSYISCYWLLRHVLRIGTVPSLLGALFFALGYPKASQLGHFQLRFDFFQPLALGLILPLWIDDREFRPAEIALRLNGFVAVYCLGALTAFYHAWFFLFWVGMTALVAALFPGPRRRGIHLFRQARPILWQPVVLSAVLLLPFFALYLPAREATQGRHWIDTLQYSPSFMDYLRLGPDNVVWGWLSLNSSPSNIEKRLGLGLVVSLALLSGWVWSFRYAARVSRRKLGAPATARMDLLAAALLSALLITFLTIHWGSFYPWWLVYQIVPGASALNAAGRWVLTLMLPASILLSQFAAGIIRVSRGRAGLLAGASVILVLFVAEQAGRIPYQYSSAVAIRYHQKIVKAIPPDCSAFLLTPPYTDRMLTEEEFDSARYLRDNIDVARGMARGWPKSAYEHYSLFGYREGRKAYRLNSGPDSGMISEEHFDAKKYLEANPDVAQNWPGTAWEHYKQFGFREGRSLDPDEAARLRSDNFHYHVSALITSALSGRPTLNGASGLLPISYPLSNIVQPHLERPISEWHSQHPSTQPCIVRKSLPEADLKKTK